MGEEKVLGKGDHHEWQSGAPAPDLGTVRALNRVGTE